MTDIKANLTNITNQLEQLRQQHHNPNVELLAVSKTKPASQIQAAYDWGQRKFGENYVQEAVEKIQQLTDLVDIQWHFIGPIQSNKTKLIAENFSWVQSIDRAKIATRLNDQRPSNLPPLNVCVQVNVSGEQTKSGLEDETELEDLCRQIDQAPNLTLRGLMAIPAPSKDPQQIATAHNKMQQLYTQLQSQYTTIDTLSMGMSNDMDIAIAQGSTMVRVGTAIFGARG